ncbi:hypothetical protein F7725_001968 [Dissostichus mawsoni]|uniref:Uncharacterized protein n=1 Tax=Dissostichus mawsoni TaxID=36200 RepID=A0A7J5Y2W1_DISMA|nr:hypothetical protein F7725_001968 [Dissostichus mawsoni]
MQTARQYSSESNPQTRREHSCPSQAGSTNAPAWHDTGRTQHEPNTRLRYYSVSAAPHQTSDSSPSSSALSASRSASAGQQTNSTPRKRVPVQVALTLVHTLLVQELTLVRNEQGIAHKLSN